MPPTDYYEEEENIFGAYNYLTYMAQNASKGAPLPVYFSMAEDESGDFDSAMDEHIENINADSYDPADEWIDDWYDYEEEEDDLPDYAEFFVPEEGDALHDSFDTIEDGDMEQGLGDLENIVSSTIPTFLAYEELYPEEDIAIDEYREPDYGGFGGESEDIQDYQDVSVPRFLAYEELYPEEDIVTGPDLGPLGASVRGLEQRITSPPSTTEKLIGTIVDEVLGKLGPIVKDVAGNIPALAMVAGGVPGDTGENGDIDTDYLSDDKAYGGFGGEEEESQDYKDVTIKDVTISEQQKIFNALNDAYPDIDQIQYLIDNYEYTENEIRLWMSSEGFAGKGDTGFLDSINTLFDESGGTTETEIAISKQKEESAVDKDGTMKGILKIVGPDKEDPLGKAPSYSDQFIRIFNNIPGSQRIEAQRGMTSMFNDAEMLFYLMSDWSDRDWLTGETLQNPSKSLKLSEEDREGEEMVFANWVQNTYLQNPRQTRFGEEFYGSVRDLRDRMTEIKDLSMEELYDTLVNIENESPEQAKKTVMNKFVFMDPSNAQSSKRLAQLVGMYNIHPDTDHWLKNRMMNFYEGMMQNWKASGRDSYDFINAFVKDRPAMPGGEGQQLGLIPSGTYQAGTDFALDEQPYISPMATTLPAATPYSIEQSLDIEEGTIPYTPPPAYVPIPEGHVRMGSGEIVTLAELRRRIAPPKTGVEKWKEEFEDVLSGLKW